MMRRALFSGLLSSPLIFLVLFTLAPSPPPQITLASPAEPQPNYVPGELVVKFKGDATEPERAQALSELGAQRVQTFRKGAEHWRFAPSQDVPEAAEWLRANPAVQYAHPNYLVEPAFNPNDVRYHSTVASQ